MRRSTFNSRAIGMKIVCCLSAVRHHSKMGMEGFSNLAFNRAADKLLEEIETAVELCDSDVVEDISLSDGVLTIDTSKGSFVLNKQAPNVQLWLSSPVSGPHHYDMVEVARGTIEWRCDKDSHSLISTLEKELSDLLSTTVAIAQAKE